ncbi:OmpA family protein [uncultured Fibrella sp.]|uniref:OmpA family protein n=1 Tax=uncultured Fibrella sp. TaxID=1284596 RepID=UPI0035C96E4A
MFSSILLFIVCLVNGYSDQGEQPKNGQSIRIYGSCYNVATGADLLVDAFVVAEGKKVKIGTSTGNGKFDFQLPVSATYLSFEADGYQPVSAPVQFSGEMEENARFMVYVPMSATGSLALPPLTRFSLFFIAPNDLDIDYKLTKLNSATYSTRLQFTSGHHIPNLELQTIAPGNYMLATAINHGQVINDEPVTIGKGFTFKIIRFPKPSVLATTASLPFATKLVYFDQSSYDLRADTKASLDSVSRLLLSQPTKVIKLTGYTDNVGKRDLNVTLSEYRVRTIVNYLQQRGINPAKIVSVWKGPDSPNAPNDSEENKSKNRRVAIQLIPN